MAPPSTSRKKGGKASRGRALRAVRRAEPVIVEGEKLLLGLRGPSSSDLVVDALRDLLALKKPGCVLLSRRNDVRPFEDAASLEFLAERAECGAFLLATHQTKRPHNLLLGRIYDGHVLDMVELGLVGFEGLADIPGPKKSLGSRVLFVFGGEGWDRGEDLPALRSLILDVWGQRGGSADATSVALEGKPY